MNAKISGFVISVKAIIIYLEVHIIQIYTPWFVGIELNILFGNQSERKNTVLRVGMMPFP